MCSRRARPLVLVASPNRDLARRLVQEVQRSGSVACLAQSAAGCLRVATADSIIVPIAESRACASG